MRNLTKLMVVLAVSGCLVTQAVAIERVAVDKSGRGEKQSEASFVDGLRDFVSDLVTRTNEIEGELEKAEGCGNVGMIYAPEHPESDENGCFEVSCPEPPEPGEVEYTTAGEYSFTVPDRVTLVRVRVIGGGGGPAINNCFGNKCFSAGAGAGGGYAEGVVAVTPGQTYKVTVGKGGNRNETGDESAFYVASSKKELYATGGTSAPPHSNAVGTGGKGYNGSRRNVDGTSGSPASVGGKGVTANGRGGVSYLAAYGAGANGVAQIYGNCCPGKDGAVLINWGL